MFKVAGPMWAQATVGDNVFARLVKTGKKVLRRVLQRELEPTAGREIPKPTWSLRSQTVKVEESSGGRLIGGLFPKQVLKTQAAEARRQAALRLIRDSRKVPVFAFVSLSLAASLDQKKGETDDVLFSGIRSLFQEQGGKARRVDAGGQQFTLQSLQLGQLIGQGCNAAVFQARPAHPNQPEEETEEEGEKAEETSGDEQSADQVPGSVETHDDVPCLGNNMEEDCLPSHIESAKDEDDDISILSEDDDISILSEGDDISIISEDDDISIISESEEDAGGTSDESLEGWVLYKLSPVSTTSAADEVCDDSDSDIFILAGDEEGLESLPDLEDLTLESGWSVIGGPMPEAGTAGVVTLDATLTERQQSDSDASAGQLDSSLCEDRTSVTTQDPERPPNIAEDEEFPLAVKMMYNYNVESRADHIMSAMVRETVPAMSTPDGERRSVSMTKRLPPHPNIVTMHDVFVDQIPDLPEGAEWYPSALPPRLNSDGGFGRNATMFLVMKRYSMTLSQYLSEHNVDTRTRCLLFAQLLEGVAHLTRHHIAHRDLKANNVLLDLSEGADSPSLAISDFGSCLADPHYGLELPYLTDNTDRGGNSALMAPEIKCAVAGPGRILDYSKADVWAAGTLAYEIFGEGNPFYHGFDSRSYREEDLPKLPDETPEVVVRLVEAMVKRNPSERPSAAVAATCLEMFLWGPPAIHPFPQQGPKRGNPLWKHKEISHWLEILTMETVCQRVFGGPSSGLELRMKSALLSRVSREDVFGVLSLQT